MHFRPFPVFLAKLIFFNFWVGGPFSAWILVRRVCQTFKALQRGHLTSIRGPIIQNLFHGEQIIFHFFYFFSTKGGGARRLVENSTNFFFFFEPFPYSNEKEHFHLIFIVACTLSPLHIFPRAWCYCTSVDILKHRFILYSAQSTSFNGDNYSHLMFFPKMLKTFVVII